MSHTAPLSPAAYCHVYGQLGQAGARFPEVLAGLSRRKIPADIDFDLSVPKDLLAECVRWQKRGNIVAPNVYPPDLDPSCTSRNWWSYSVDECTRLLTILRERLVAMGFDQTDAINAYTPGNNLIRAAKKLGFRHLLGFCGPTCANDGHWQITHTGAPLAPFFAGDEDYRKPEMPPGGGGFLISNMELRNPLTCVENWNEGPFCPLNLLMGDRTIEAGGLPVETMAMCEDFIRLGELTGTPRFFHINLQYFTSPKCFDLNERMLDWLKVQEQCGRLQFIGLRDYATMIREHGGVLPQTTWWRGECMGQHVGGQRGEGNEAIISENAAGQWQFRKGEAGAERYFDYLRPWDYPPFHPKAELPLSEGYGVDVRRLASVTEDDRTIRVKFEVSALSGGGVQRFCLWDAVREVQAPFTVEALGEGVLAAEVVPHPGGSGAALLLEADLSASFEGEITVIHGGRKANDHSQNWEDLVIVETTWLHGQPITRVASTVPYPLDLTICHSSRSPVQTDWILGKAWGTTVLPPGGDWSGRLDGSLSSSVVRFHGVTASQLDMTETQRADLVVQAERQTMRMADGESIPAGEILRYSPESKVPAWLHEVARKRADAEVARANSIVSDLASARGGRVVAAIHMAADLAMGTKGRVRSAFLDRNERDGAAELFAIYYDYGQTYQAGVSGWNQFWRINLGARGLKTDKAYAVILNIYDPEERMTTIRITANATNVEAETTDSSEVVLTNSFLAEQGLDHRFAPGAFRLLSIPKEICGSGAVNVNVYSNGEQRIYDRLTEDLGFVFLSHAWLVEV